MRLTITVVGPRSAERADVLIDADGGMPMRELAWRLAVLLDGRPEDQPGSVPALYVEGDRLAPDLTLYDSPVCHGAVVGLGSPSGTTAPEPFGHVEVRIVGGEGAGAVHRLGPGEYTVGSARDSRIQLHASAGHAQALTLLVSADGECRIRPAARAGVTLDRAELKGGAEARWKIGSQVRVGAVLLERAYPSRPDAAVLPSDDGVGVDYNRPPRLQPARQPATFRYPARPTKPEKRGFPLLLIILTPLVMAGGSYLLFRNPAFLLFALMSPLIMVGSQISNRRQGKKSYQQRVREYEDEVAALRRDIDAAVIGERAQRRVAVPDPAAALLITTGPRQRLWERRWSDPDFLHLRVGSADLPSAIKVEDPSRKDRQDTNFVTEDVPMTLPFRDLGVVGLAGTGTVPASVARWLVAQAAALHSPSDLRVCVLSGSDGEDQWRWVHWLPHASPLVDDGMAMLGTDSTSVGVRIAGLNALMEARQAAGERSKRMASDGDPDVLVVLDGARRLRSLPGVVQLLRKGPAAGIYILCVETEQRFLPEECMGVAVAEDDGLLSVDLGRSGAFPGVVPDAPSATWCTVVARAMAPIRDVGDAEDDGALPAAARLLDVLEMEPPTPGAITANWSLGGRSTRAVLGVGLDGPFALDIVRDGPHGLVAGTTGAGKSELLQTLVASLAVANRPDALTFVLIDYKGGSAFKDCVELPHTVGMVTDLDAHLVERALVSLGAELKRREHLLAGVGAKDIEDYQEKPGVPAMPRLLLVIDEFASMVRELPDFVKGLVNIAQRGRSLGIHLILATQRPAGAVTADIRANTNLRIALRTTDSTESRDVIDAPESAYISRSTPGRAYARLGQAALLPFQAGRVGGRRPGTEQAALTEPFLAELTWDDLGGPPLAPPAPLTSTVEQSELTDLAVLVETIRKASAELGIPPQPSPWLAPLPAALTLAELPPVATPDRALAPVAYGLVDVPAEQAQQPLLFDLETTGHLLLIASPRSGRSSTLRTLAGALAARHGCADVHVYGLDFGNGALLPLVDLPHCGAVVSRTETERVTRLLNRLLAEIARRQSLLAAHGVADLAELRTAGTPTPHVVLMVDRWEAFEQAFATYDSGSVLEQMKSILREGAGAGVHVVAAGDRTLTASRYTATTEDKLVFRLNDKADYALAALSRKAVPEDMPSGRAVRVADAAELQIALLDPDPSGAAQVAALRRIAEQASARDASVPDGQRPFSVDVLPDRVSFEHAWAQRPDQASSLWAMVGVGGDQLSTYGADLGRVPSFVIAGPPRAGRSTALATMALSLLANGVQIVVVTPKNSPLRALRGRPGVVAVLEGDVALDDYRTAVQSVQTPTGAVLVDDAELLIHSELDTDLSALSRGLAGEGWGLVTAGTAEALAGGVSGWHVHARRNRHGLLLAPRSTVESELLGVRLSSGMVGGNPIAGRAHVHLGDGALRTVQVPHTEL